MAARAGKVLDDDYSRMLGVFTKAWNPYSVVDVFAQWKINDRLTLDLSAENLLDAYYVDAINNTDMPAPGRTIRATLTGKFGDSTPWPAGQLFNRSAGGVPGADWTGLYVGGHVGQGFAALKGTTTAMNGTPSLYSAAEATDMKLNNFLFGGQVGFNYQFDNRFVAGFEADFSKTRIQGFQEVLANETSYIAARNQLASKTIFAFNGMGTIRGRVGYAFDRFFVYGTAGLAFMKETDTRAQYKATNVSTTFLSGTATERSFEERTTVDRRGWTIGAGAEYAVTSQWSIKGEYLYSHFGADDFRFPKATAGLASTATCTRYYANGSCRIWSLTGPPTNGRTASSSVDLHAIKMGVNYRF
jgi:hemoglobin/transferrin/lactoferrin receptor protein